MKLYRKLSHVQLENQLFIPGFGELKGSVLSAQFYPDIRMVMSDNGVDCVVHRNGRAIEFFIPFNRIEACIYINAEEKDKTNVKAA